MNLARLPADPGTGLALLAADLAFVFDQLVAKGLIVFELVEVAARESPGDKKQAEKYDTERFGDVI